MIVIAGVNLLFLFLFFYRDSRLFSFREEAYSLIYSIASYVAVTYLYTEVVSLWKGFYDPSIFALHGGIFCIFAVAWTLKRGWRELLGEARNLGRSIWRKGKEQKIPFVFWAGFGLLVLLISWNTVPYNHDSMAYRLPRILQWLHRGSIELYATNYPQQVESPVLTEVINAHVLTGGYEKAFNFLQCFSYLINCFLVYRLAGMLKCSGLWRYLGTLLFASTPIVFAEAFTTQADQFSALWVLSFAYLILGQISAFEQWDRPILLHNLLAMGVITGLAYVTKINVMIPMLWLGLFFEVACFRYGKKSGMYGEQIWSSWVWQQCLWRRSWCGFTWDLGPCFRSWAGPLCL